MTIETMQEIQARNCDDCAMFIHELRIEKEHNYALTQKIKEQTLRIETMSELLKIARDDYLEQHFDGEHDCPTPYDVYIYPIAIADKAAELNV